MNKINLDAEIKIPEAMQKLKELEKAVTAAIAGATADIHATEMMSGTFVAEPDKHQTTQLEEIIRQSVDVILSEQTRCIEEIKERYLRLRDQVAKMFSEEKIDGVQATHLYGKIDDSEQQEIWNQILNGIKAYEQRRLEVQEEFSQKREALYEADGTTLRSGVTAENIEETNSRENAALAAVDEAFAQWEAPCLVWMEEIVEWSVLKLKEVFANADKELESLEKSGTGNPSQLSAARTKVNSLEKSIAEEDANADSSGNSQKNSAKKWQELQKTLKNVSAELKTIGETIGGTAGEVISLAGTVADSTLDIIDNVWKVVDNTVTGVTETTRAASTSIQALETASVILMIISAALKIAMAIVKIVQRESQATKNYEELKKKYEGLLKVWDDLIARKKEYLDVSWGEELRAVHGDMMALTKQKEESQRALALARLSAGASSGSHSYGYRMWKGSYKANGQNWSDVAGDIKSGLGVDITGMQDFTSLSAEQLLWIKEHYGELWAAMDGDFREALENIIQYGDDADEAIKAYKEQLTQISFDEFYGNFVDTLMDMDASAEDFANSLSEMLMRAVLSSMIGQKYADELEKWYTQFSEDMEAGDGQLTDEQIENLRKWHESIAERALAERDQLAAVVGYGNSSASAQEASARGFQSMSQETGNELNGRFTDIQSKVIDIRDYILQITANGTLQLNETINIRDIMIQINGNVADIRGYAKVLPAMNDTLASMNRKLENL